MLNKINFSFYKAFEQQEEVEIRPITLIVGKNSSGKSSILKLFPMFSKMLDTNCSHPLLLNNNGISLGTEYEDLFHNKKISQLHFGVEFENDVKIHTEYYINNGNISIARIDTTKGEQIISRDLEEDKSRVKGLLDLEALHEMEINPEELKLDVNYIGPFRTQAPHNIIFQGFNDDLMVGYKGAEAYNILLNSYKSDKVLFNKVAEWTRDNLQGQYLKFTNVSNNNGTYGLMVSRNGLEVNTTAVGQGLAQVLPIIVQSFMAKEKSVNVVEQPALHLHPAAHSNVAIRLGASAKERNCKYVIESHSENLLLGFRYMVTNPEINFSPADVIIYFVKDTPEGSFLQRIEIDDNGDLSEWPTGVFGEAFDLLCEINKFRK